MRHHLALAAFVGCAITYVQPVRADDAACIAAAEGELPLRQQGRLHDALKQLARCADPSCPDVVTAECGRRIGEIDAAMPTLILVAKDGAGNDLSDVRVSMDGAPLASTLDGRSIAVDPGSHTFVFETAGQRPVEKKLVLREGEKERREAVLIGPPPAPAPPATPAPTFWTSRRALALASAGAGVVALGLGSALGLYALSSQNREKSDCSTASCPNRNQAVEDYNTAQTDATASTVLVGVGAAALAAGVVLWFTAPSTVMPRAAARPRLEIVPTLAGRRGALVLQGAF